MNHCPCGARIEHEDEDEPIGISRGYFEEENNNEEREQE